MISLLSIIMTIVVSAASSLAQAEAVDWRQDDGLQDVLVSYSAMMENKDFDAAVQFMPPSLLSYIANVRAEPLVNVRQSLADDLHEAYKFSTITAYDFDLENAYPVTVPDGRAYMMVPTEVLEQLQGDGRTKLTFHTLAMTDAGSWYLMALDKPQAADVLRVIYPELDTLEVPESTLTLLENEASE